MEYWETTEEIQKNYAQLQEKQAEYGKLLRELLVTETAIGYTEITECLLHSFGFKLNTYYSDERLEQMGLKRNSKTQIITPYVRTVKGKQLKKKYERITFPKINSFRILDIIPNYKFPFGSWNFQFINNKLVIITDADLSEYGCIKKVI